MKKIGVYSIKSPSNKIYIGSSKDIFKRWNAYKKLNCKAQVKLYNSFVKYGVDAHVFKIELECEENERLHWEHHFSNYYKSIENGLNLRIPGYNETPDLISIESRIRMSENHPYKKHESYRIKNKNHLLNIVNSDNFKNKVKQYWTNDKKIERGNKQSKIWANLTDEQKKERIKKRVESQKIKNNGSYHSNEFKLKLSQRTKGKKLSQSHKQKLSLNNKNKRKIICIETNEVFDSMIEATKILNISFNTILRNINGVTKKNKLKLNFKYLCQQEESENQAS